ncbi:MAG: FHA domain-containing protein [Pseudanabaenaceae cyanobacterium]
MTAQLLLQTSRGTSRLNLDNGRSWSMGRGRDNAVPLYDHCASRQHALILKVGGFKYYLMDLGSRNGTYLNGKRIHTPVLLHPKDRISIGETTLEFAMSEPQTTDFSKEDTEIRLQKRRLITALVVDIRNYSKMTQQINERLLTEVITKWFKSAINIVEQQGSWVDELVGNAFLALWIHEADADIQQVAITEILTAFRAVQALSRLCAELNQQYELTLPLTIGAGINTGYAYVEISEVQEIYPDLQVIADATTKAFALEVACRELNLDVAIAESTHRRTSYASVLLPFKQYVLNLPNNSEPISAYAGTLAGIDHFLEKVNLVFTE